MEKKKSRHHLIPKSRRLSLRDKYSKEQFNKTLRLWMHKHHLWHALFANQTLEETIAILTRIKKIKKL